MIISMNATVCGDINHGEKGRFMIAGSGREKGVPGGRKRCSDQGI
jgi:hypothetical protein